MSDEGDVGVEVVNIHLVLHRFREESAQFCECVDVVVNLCSGDKTAIRNMSIEIEN